MPPKGYKFTPEQLKRLSDSHKGIKPSSESIEKRASVMRGRPSPLKGIKYHTEEYKEAMRKLLLERIAKGEFVVYPSAGWNKGIPLTEEQKERISELTKAGMTEEVRHHISVTNRGRRGKPPTRGEDYSWVWNKVRKYILEQDNYTCQACGSTSRQLNVHHIHAWESTRDNHPLDLITLCVVCHRKVERETLCLFLMSIINRQKEYAS